MKKIFFLASAFVLGLTVNAQQSDQTKPDDVAKFIVEKHDFSKIKQGVPVTYDFEVKNISNKPLVVENTTVTCGCTTPEKPTEPIMPGASAKIKVQYNAAAVGPFTKTIYVQFANVTGQKPIEITGEVLLADAYDEWVKQQPVKKEPAATSKTKPAGK